MVLLIPHARWLCVACRGVLGRARSDPPHSSPDVCADDRRHRGLRHYLVQGLIDEHCRRHRIACSDRRAVVAAQFSARDVPGDRIRRSSARPDGRPVARNLAEFRIYLVSAALEGNRDTWARLPHNALGIPVLRLLIWLQHAALAIFSRSDRGTFVEAHRQIVIAAIVCHPRLSRDVRDRVRLLRWISNWAVCLFLILHAVKCCRLRNTRCRYRRMIGRRLGSAGSSH